MRIEGQRRSSNFEDRGSGSGPRGAGGVPIQALAGLVRLLGIKGTLIVGVLFVVGYAVLPAGLKEQLLGPSDPPSLVRFDLAVKALCAKADDRRARMESRLADEVPSPRKPEESSDELAEGETTEAMA